MLKNSLTDAAYLLELCSSAKIYLSPFNIDNLISRTRLDITQLGKSQILLRYLVTDRFEAGRRPAASWNVAYHLAR